MNRALWIGPLLVLVAGIWWLGRAPEEGAPLSDHGRTDRLVSLAPSLTEIVLALGAADRLVGVTTFCEGVDPGVSRVGNLRRPDLEAILRVEPDRVLAIETREQQSLLRLLRGRGIVVETFPAEFIDDVRAALSRLGERLGAGAEAEGIIARLDAALVPPDHPPLSGVFVVQRQPLMVAGGGSFVDEMLTAAGIANICHDRPEHYLRIELEQLLERDPVIILDGSFGETDPAAFWSRFLRLRAVREGGVEAFPPVRPGVGIPVWIEDLRRRAAARRP